MKLLNKKEFLKSLNESSINESLGNLNKFLEEYLKKNNYTLEDGGDPAREEFNMYDLDHNLVAWFNFTSTDGENFEFEDESCNGEYIATNTIEVEPEFRNKGVYFSILSAVKELAKSKGLDGVLSPPYDLDSGEVKRSKLATDMWKHLVKKGLAIKAKSEDGDYFILK